MAKGFDRLSPYYDRLAKLAFGKSIQKVQTHFLPQIPQNGRVLILGGGTGWFLLDLLRKAQPAEVVYVDLSKEMIRSSEKLVAESCPSMHNKVKFVQGELWDLQNEDPFDVVVTHFYLDLFPEGELVRVMQRIRELLAPGGIWMFADFVQPSKGRMRLYAAIMIPVMYAFFRFFCQISAKKIPDFFHHFDQIGMIERESVFFFGKIISGKIFSVES